MSTKTTHAPAKNAHAKGADHKGEELKSPQQERLAKGEHITQHKPDVREAMANSGGIGENKLSEIGQGTHEELAPAVRSAEASNKADAKRVVQQGDEVVVHGRAIIDGETSMHGKVVKVNEDGTLAVRVLRTTGATFDVPGPVKNHDAGDGSLYWTWPVEETLADEKKSA